MIFSFLIYSVVVIFFNSPTQFPLSSKCSVIDCYAYQSNDIYSEGNNIWIILSVDEFIEYPHSVAPSLLRICTKTNVSESDFNINHFQNISYKSKKLSFSIVHQINGHVSVSLYCQNRLIGEKYLFIDNITSMISGYSYSFSTNNTVATIQNFCMSNNVILFFSPQFSNYLPLQVTYESQIRINVVSDTIYSFLAREKSFSYQKNPILFITSNPTYRRPHLIDIVLPIWDSMMSYQQNSNVDIYLLRNQTNIIDSIAPIMKGLIHTPGPNRCFNMGRFVKTSGSESYNIINTRVTHRSESLASQFEWISSFSQTSIQSFRESYTSSIMIKGRIVLDSGMIKYVGLIRSLYPQCKVFVLGDNDSLKDVASLVKSAHIFICSHLSTIVFGLFLSEKATLVELMPIGAECFTQGEAIAKLVNCNYLPINKKESCPCTTLSCYFTNTSVYETILEEEIRKIIEIAFSY